MTDLPPPPSSSKLGVSEDIENYRARAIAKEELPVPRPKEEGGGRVLAIIAVVITWAVAIVSVVKQKLDADRVIREVDVSAVQVQQLSGQVAAHALVVLVIAGGITAVVGVALSATRR